MAMKQNSEAEFLVAALDADSDNDEAGFEVSRGFMITPDLPEESALVVTKENV